MENYSEKIGEVPEEHDDYLLLVKNFVEKYEQLNPRTDKNKNADGSFILDPKE
ncbi:MAG: hypothetical protein KAI18_03915 [Candidatus Aenigmarchaeota archaeon]|nr:hypothetical protein [Candidatus Aenigmarchaeota archaeon]